MWRPDSIATDIGSPGQSAASFRLFNGRSVFYHKAATHDFECPFDYRHWRLTAGVEKPVNRILLQAQPLGQDVDGDAQFPHCLVESQLGCERGRRGNWQLPRFKALGTGTSSPALTYMPKATARQSLALSDASFQDQPPALAPYTSGNAAV